MFTVPSFSSAQSVEDIRWKSEQQVAAMLGEPLSKSSPIGTHAAYTLWSYEGFIVAFADNKAFHLFKVGSLNRVELSEGRTN